MDQFRASVLSVSSQRQYSIQPTNTHNPAVIPILRTLAHWVLPLHIPFHFDCEKQYLPQGFLLVVPFFSQYLEFMPCCLYMVTDSLKLQQTINLLHPLDSFDVVDDSLLTPRLEVIPLVHV